MKNRKTHLKIKIKSLAAEQVIIRDEARKCSGMDKWDLNHHRTSHVRPYIRENHLAYGFLKGIPYSRMENRCHEAPDWDEVEKLVRRFGVCCEHPAYLTHPELSSDARRHINRENMDNFEMALETQEACFAAWLSDAKASLVLVEKAAA